MKKYCLCYIENKVIKDIDLSKLKDSSNKMDFIDNFTMLFNNENELIIYLQNKNLINRDTNKIYLGYKTNEGNKICYDGDILLFKNDKEHLNMNYIKRIIEKYKEEPRKMLIICKMYIKKYNNTPLKDKLNDLMTYVNSKLDNSYESLSYEEKYEIDSYIDKFINIEFYRVNSKGEKKTNYSNMREFLIKKKYIDNNINVDRKHSYIKYNFVEQPKVFVESNDDTYTYEEEFLGEQDFKRSDKEILDNYSCDYEAYIDGIDYIAPLSKEELEKTLNGYKDEFIKKYTKAKLD